MPYPELIDQPEEAKKMANLTENFSPAKKVDRPIWLSVSEAAKLTGLKSKTVRRAIEEELINFTVKNNRYRLEFASVMSWAQSRPKLKKKFQEQGLGQYLK